MQKKISHSVRTLQKKEEREISFEALITCKNKH